MVAFLIGVILLTSLRSMSGTEVQATTGTAHGAAAPVPSVIDALLYKVVQTPAVPALETETAALKQMNECCRTNYESTRLVDGCFTVCGFARLTHGLSTACGLVDFGAREGVPAADSVLYKSLNTTLSIVEETHLVRNRPQYSLVLFNSLFSAIWYANENDIFLSGYDWVQPLMQDVESRLTGGQLLSGLPSGSAGAASYLISDASALETTSADHGPELDGVESEVRVGSEARVGASGPRGSFVPISCTASLMSATDSESLVLSDVSDANSDVSSMRASPNSSASTLDTVSLDSSDDSRSMSNRSESMPNRIESMSNHDSDDDDCEEEDAAAALASERNRLELEEFLRSLDVARERARTLEGRTNSPNAGEFDDDDEGGSVYNGNEPSYWMRGVVRFTSSDSDEPGPSYSPNASQSPDMLSTLNPLGSLNPSSNAQQSSGLSGLNSLSGLDSPSAVSSPGSESTGLLSRSSSSASDSLDAPAVGLPPRSPADPRSPEFPIFLLDQMKATANTFYSSLSMGTSSATDPTVKVYNPRQRERLGDKLRWMLGTLQVNQVDFVVAAHAIKRRQCSMGPNSSLSSNSSSRSSSAVAQDESACTAQMMHTRSGLEMMSTVMDSLLPQLKSENRPLVISAFVVYVRLLARAVLGAPYASVDALSFFSVSAAKTRHVPPQVVALFDKHKDAIGEILMALGESADGTGLTGDYFAPAVCASESSLVISVVAVYLADYCPIELRSFVVQRFSKNLRISSAEDEVLAEATASAGAEAVAVTDVATQLTQARVDYSLLEGVLGSYIDDMDEADDLEAAPLDVSRSNPVETSFMELNALRPSQIRESGLKIRFHREDDGVELGIDAGGPTNEFLTLFTERVFSEAFGLFAYSDASGSYHFAPDVKGMGSWVRRELSMAVGRLLGFSAVSGRSLGIQVSRVMYQFMVGAPDTVGSADLSSLDRQLYDTLALIKKDKPESTYLYFTASVVGPGGTTTDVDLVPNGGDIELSVDRIDEYMTLNVRRRFVDEFRSELEALRQGFADVVGDMNVFTSIIRTHSALNGLIFGNPEIDVAKWEASTQYLGTLAATSDEVVWFWNIVGRMSQEDKRRLLRFATGRDTVPVEGFALLRPQRFTLQRGKGTKESLPGAHTCFNTMDLQPYTSEEQMEPKVLYAIRHGVTYENA